MRFFERLFGSRHDEGETAGEEEAEADAPFEHHPTPQSESDFYEGFVDRRDDAAVTGGGGGGMFPVLPESTPSELGGQFEDDSNRPADPAP